MSDPFRLKDCTVVSIATGVKAQTLSELRDRLTMIHPSSIYFHFWGGRLRVDFEHHQYQNDFAFWSHRHIHDDILGERLELIDPTGFDDIEALRNELVGLIDQRLDEIEWIPWSKSEERFHFVKSKIIIFDTPHQISEPKQLVGILPQMSPSSIFFHTIDASRRNSDKSNDFSAWLKSFGGQYQDLIAELDTIDPYFISLADLQSKLSAAFTTYFTPNE